MASPSVVLLHFKKGKDDGVENLSLTQNSNQFHAEPGQGSLSYATVLQMFWNTVLTILNHWPFGLRLMYVVQNTWLVAGWRLHNGRAWTKWPFSSDTAKLNCNSRSFACCPATPLFPLCWKVTQLVIQSYGALKWEHFHHLIVLSSTHQSRLVEEAKYDGASWRLNEKTVRDNLSGLENNSFCCSELTILG